MGIAVTFYTNFNKQGNSTRQPTGGTVINCELRDGSGVLEPNLEVRGVTAFQYNYMYIPDFKRYYYINTFNWNANEGFWLISGISDPLASAKEQILVSTQYILRADDLTNNDVRVIDGLATSLNVLTSRYTYDIVGESGEHGLPPVESNFTNLTVVCNVAGEGFFCMSGQAYNNMMSDFFGTNQPTGTQWVSQDIARQIVNPSSHFISQMGFPFNFSGISSQIVTGSGIHPTVAWWNLNNVTAWRMNRTHAYFLGHVTMGYHPQSNNDNTHYLNAPPYVDYSLYIGGLGMIGLDNSKVNAGENLEIRLDVDFASGGAKVKVTNESGQVCGYATGDCGFDLAMVSRRGSDSIGLITNTVIGGVIGGPMGAVSGLVTGGINAVNGSGGAVVHGSTGGFSGWREFPYSRIMATYRRVIEPYVIKEGVPVCKTKTLSDMTGYVLCRNASVQTHLTRSETLEIENTLNTGCFIE